MRQVDFFYEEDTVMSYPVIDPVATGARINTYRIDRGFSVASLREYFGLSTTNAIYKWLRGVSQTKRY